MSVKREKVSVQEFPDVDVRVSAGLHRHEHFTMYVSIQGFALTRTGKIGGQKLGTKMPRQPEGVRER